MSPLPVVDATQFCQHVAELTELIISSEQSKYQASGSRNKYSTPVDDLNILTCDRCIYPIRCGNVMLVKQHYRDLLLVSCSMIRYWQWIV